MFALYQVKKSRRYFIPAPRRGQMLHASGTCTRLVAAALLGYLPGNQERLPRCHCRIPRCCIQFRGISSSRHARTPRVFLHCHHSMMSGAVARTGCRGGASCSAACSAQIAPPPQNKRQAARALPANHEKYYHAAFHGPRRWHAHACTTDVFLPLMLVVVVAGSWAGRYGGG